MLLLLQNTFMYVSKWQFFLISDIINSQRGLRNEHKEFHNVPQYLQLTFKFAICPKSH